MVQWLKRFLVLFFQASVYPNYRSHFQKTPYFSTDEKTVQLPKPADPYTPRLSELVIEKIEQPIKCGTEITATIKYYFVGETVEKFNAYIVYMVSTCAHSYSDGLS